MIERKQDMWQVIISGTNKAGLAAHPLQMEGAISLRRPMTALDAADHTLRLTLPLAMEYVVQPKQITVSVWGRTDIGSDLVRHCSAVAEYDADRETYLRYAPWIDDNEYQPIGEPGDATFLSFG